MSDDTTLNQARQIRRTIKQLQDRVLRHHGPFTIETDGFSAELTFTQLSTLIAIRDHGEMSLKELAEATHVSPPSASTMVEKLVEMKAITREHSRVDRREVRVALSQRGLRAVNSLEQTMLEELIELLEGIGPDFAEQWIQVYERIETYIQQSGQRPAPTNSSAVGVK